MKKILFVLSLIIIFYFQSFSFGQKKIIEYRNMEYGVFDSSGTKMFYKISEEAIDYREELDFMIQNNLDTVCVDYQHKAKERWLNLYTKEIHTVSSGILYLDTKENMILVAPDQRDHYSNETNYIPLGIIIFVIMFLALIFWFRWLEDRK
ncbi:MAG: hypothetical protein U0469_02895 [Candidatus Paceibacterota bacterium]